MVKISQWLGYNEDASQYLLRSGELRVLNNLQSRRPGMLIARKGLAKTYGKYNDEAIYGLYRRATTIGTPSDFLWLQKVKVERPLTVAQIQDRESPEKYVWRVSRIQGYESRVIDTQEISPDGTNAISNFCVAEDRHGRMFMFYGYGVRPRVYRPDSMSNVALDMGLDPPTVAPSVLPSGSGYFIEGVDVAFGGGAYYAPPTLTLSGGSPDREAKLTAIVQSGNVVGVDILDGGANYQSAPTITASLNNIGSGFRAKGNISGSARTVEGFSDTDPAVVTGTAATASQTYGATNGTTGNSIMYRVRQSVATERVRSASGTTLTLGSVSGIAVGDAITMYPAVAPFSTTAVTVTAINTASKTVQFSGTSWTPAAGVVYEATFFRLGVTQQAAAAYDSAARRFTANVPLSSASSSGRGAYATLQFSPTPLGYGLNSNGTSSVAVTNVNFQTYLNDAKQYVPYLYNDFWEGSDYDQQNSAENARYGGLQASGSSYARGYTGTIKKARSEVYWPDYSRISVWFCTGTYSSNSNQWTRADVAVQTEADPVSGVSAKVLKFRLQPSQQAQTVKSLGKSQLATQYQSYDTLPDAVAPEVKLYLTECPDSWVVDESQCLPTSVKEERADRLPWWSSASGVARPIVGITPIGQEVTASAVVITDPGSGWQSGTKFAFRLYQANPYDQYVDTNTSQVGSNVARGHKPYDLTNRYVDFVLTANAPDNQTPHGPPGALLTPAVVSMPGDGYSAGQSGTITLGRRALAGDVSTAVDAQTLTWTAKTLDTLSTTSTGSIASVTVVSKGNNYLAPPQIEVRGGGAGYGLSVRPNIVSGRIESVQILDPGAGYTTSPELYTSARAAQLTPVMRPAMRGAYRCAYRFVDLSETIVATVTATIGATSTTLTLSDASAVKPDMVLDSPRLPHWSRVVSVSGDQVVINQAATGLLPGESITVSVRDMSKPVAYSDLSPIVDVDAGPNADRTHSSRMNWSLTGVRPPTRCDKVELWRTSGGQSLVFYRLEAYGVPSQDGIQIVGTDTLTDEQLFDSTRPHYAAMPVLLPNGGLNAYRFGKPRSDMAVAVAFQDRLWMGVSTSGKDVNTLYYSEFDEFESTPDTNDLPIQNNQKSTDVLTALAPFGSWLLAMQTNHTYAITYNSDPGLDASIQMVSHRGCLHQRCWDIYSNVLYAADEAGIYAMTRWGQVEDISAPLRTFFTSELIDFSKRDTFFLQVDPRTQILRFFCTLVTNPTDTPAFALCLDLESGSWWTESYPNSFTAACTGRPGSARIHTILLGGVDGNLYEIAGDSDHANESLTDAFVTQGGSGYREAPEITVPNCKGAVVKGVVSEGRLVDVIIQNSGWQAKWGIGILCESGAPLAAHDGRELKGVEYDAIKLDIGPPEAGGIQAEGYVNFSVTPRVVRDSTVSVGESFVRLSRARITKFEPDSTDVLAAESSAWLLTEAGNQIATEQTPVEVGMEAVGDYIPLNAFVSHIDGRDVYLQHPDGSPVSMFYGLQLTFFTTLQGDTLITAGGDNLIAGYPGVRINAPGTGDEFLESGGTSMRVTFYKPYTTHIPFRMATGFFPLVSDENAKNGHALIDRSVSIVYTPTPGDKDVEIIERFNGRDEMRANLMRRDRGGVDAFVHRQDSASTVLNTSKSASHIGFCTGVATAKFASRVYGDMTGEDQHLQVELYARPEQASPWQRTNFWRKNPQIKSPHPFVMHSMTVNGVVENAQ